MRRGKNSNAHFRDTFNENSVDLVSCIICLHEESLGDCELLGCPCVGEISMVFRNKCKLGNFKKSLPAVTKSVVQHCSGHLMRRARCADYMEDWDHLRKSYVI